MGGEEGKVAKTLRYIRAVRAEVSCFGSHTLGGYSGTYIQTRLSSECEQVVTFNLLRDWLLSHFTADIIL